MRKSLATLTVGSAILFGSVALAPAVWAQEPAVSRDYLGINLGAANVFDGKDSALVGLEYRGAPILWKLYPHGGGFVTHRGGVYGYAGLGLEFRITDSVLIRGNTAAGLYGQGDDKDLGHVIEFRSGVELAYELPNRAQIGLTFHHLSNAGLGDENDGTEIATVTFSMPLDKLFWD